MMIWGLVLLLVILAGLLLWPTSQQEDDTVTAREAILRELAASKAQLAEIHAEIDRGFHDEESAGRARRAMERRILQLGDRLNALDGKTSRKDPANYLKWIAPAVIALGTLTIYPLMGAPGYSRSAATPSAPEIPETLRNMSEPELIATLEEKLSQMESPDPVGYVLLGRAKLSARDFEGAVKAYETALNASENDSRIIEEFEAVKDAIARANSGMSSAAPDLNSEQADTIRAMSADQQQAQINAMVEGLAARLENDPGDLQGWLRLIRARTVLGQTEQAQTDLANAQKAFADDPEALAALSDLARNLADKR